MVEADGRNGSSRVSLSGLTGNQIVPALEAMLHALKGDLQVDVGEVHALQPVHFKIFAAAMTAWRLDGRALTFVNASDDFVDGLRAFAIDEISALKG